MKIAQENDLVLLIGQDRKQFIIRLQPGAQMQTHRGCLEHDDLLGKPLGREIRSHIGYPFVVLEPSTFDLVNNLKPGTYLGYPALFVLAAIIALVGTLLIRRIKSN